MVGTLMIDFIFYNFRENKESFSKFVLKKITFNGIEFFFLGFVPSQEVGDFLKEKYGTKKELILGMFASERTNMRSVGDYILDGYLIHVPCPLLITEQMFRDGTTVIEGDVNYDFLKGLATEFKKFMLAPRKVMKGTSAEKLAYRKWMFGTLQRIERQLGIIDYS